MKVRNWKIVGLKRGTIDPEVYGFGVESPNEKLDKVISFRGTGAEAEAVLATQKQAEPEYAYVLQRVRS